MAPQGHPQNAISQCRQIVIFTHSQPLISATTIPGHCTGHSSLQTTPKGTGTNPKAYWKLIIHPIALLAANNINTTFTAWVLGAVQRSLQMQITSKGRPSPSSIHIHGFLFLGDLFSLYISGPYKSKILPKRSGILKRINNFFQPFPNCMFYL